MTRIISHPMMGNMTLTQSDFRTVRVRQDTVDFYVRYSLIWNGEERLPESISARKDHVTAYFLTATIRDSFSAGAGYLSMERWWEVLPPGELALSFCFDFPGWIGSAYLLPGAAAGDYVGREKVTCPGDLTAYPCAVMLYAEPHSLLLFTDLPASEQQLGRIELERCSEPDDEPALRLRLLFPWQPGSGKPGSIVSPGGFQGGLRLRLVTAPREKIHQAGLAAVLNTQAARENATSLSSPSAPPPDIPRSLTDCLDAHLTRQDGLVGLRSLRAETRLSMSAGAGAALLLAEIYPRGPEEIELSLQLADTVLSAQHPGGLFYETYDLKERRWLSPDPAGNLPVACSLRITAALLRLSDCLERSGRRADKYIMASLRTVGLFLDSRQRLAYPGSRFSLETLLPRESGEELLDLAEPLALLFRRTGRDCYRKALAALQQQFLPVPPLPAAPSATAGLRLARTALTLRRIGLRVKDLPAYLSELLPWIYLNHPGGRESTGLAGSIRAEPGNPLLCFFVREWVFTLRGLNALLAPTRRLPDLDSLTARMLTAAGRAPLGCSGWLPESGYGAVDARILCREGWFALQLEKQPGQAS